MKDELITFETAKLAEKKRFKVISRYGLDSSLYNKQGKHVYYSNYGFMYSGLSDGYISAPTQSLLQKWLREVHNIHININRIYNFNKKPAIFKGYNIYISGKSSEDITYGEINNKLIRKYYNNYEKALEDGLKEALKLIK